MPQRNRVLSWLAVQAPLLVVALAPCARVDLALTSYMPSALRDAAPPAVRNWPSSFRAEHTHVCVQDVFPPARDWLLAHRTGHPQTQRVTVALAPRLQLDYTFELLHIYPESDDDVVCDCNQDH